MFPLRVLILLFLFIEFVDQFIVTFFVLRPLPVLYHTFSLLRLLLVVLAVLDIQEFVILDFLDHAIDGQAEVEEEDQKYYAL